MKHLSTEKKWLCPAILFVLLVPMQGCTSNGWKLDKPSPDSSVLTGSIATGQNNFNDTISLLDQKIIRDVVAATDKKNLSSQALGWSNSNTGSRGVISALAEVKDHGKTCRTFQTTREAFDGIMLFSGKTCEEADSSWAITDFKAL